jgi:hypothetical protein
MEKCPLNREKDFEEAETFHNDQVSSVEDETQEQYLSTEG